MEVAGVEQKLYGILGKHKKKKHTPKKIKQWVPNKINK